MEIKLLQHRDSVKKAADEQEKTFALLKALQQVLRAAKEASFVAAKALWFKEEKYTAILGNLNELETLLATAENFYGALQNKERSAIIGADRFVSNARRWRKIPGTSMSDTTSPWPETYHALLMNHFGLSHKSACWGVPPWHQTPYWHASPPPCRTGCWHKGIKWVRRDPSLRIRAVLGRSLIWNDPCPPMEAT